MSDKENNVKDKGLENLAPEGGVFTSMTDEQLRETAVRENKTLADIMLESLEKGIWPERYRAQRGSLTSMEQAALLKSTVTVIGAGGLGGAVCLLLARTGVGCIIVCDGDSFDESNLNRQMLANMTRIGTNKALAARDEIALINPAVTVKPYPCWAGTDNLPEMIEPAQVVIDCLDNMETRFLVAKTARALERPFIHGAVAGFEGLMMTVLPQGPGLADLYGPVPSPKRETAETILGVPTVTPAILAGLQVKEALNIILERPLLASGRLIHMDLSIPSLDINNLA